MTQSKRNSLNTQPRIVVIGGGLVGASFAVAMGQLGIHTLVLEAHAINDDAQPSFDERTVALTLVSQRIFSGLGVWSSIADEATPIRSIHVSDRGHFGATRLHCRDAGTQALGYVVANRTLGQGLYAALARYPCVQLAAPAEVTDLQILDEPDAGVRIDSNVGTFTTDLVVIADGGRSQLASQAGLHVREKAYSQQALVTRVRSNRAHDGQAFERFTADGPLALLPVDDTEFALAWTLGADDVERVQALDDAAFLHELQSAFGARAGEFTAVSRRHVYPLSLATLVSPVARHVAVIGNAAHTVHPVAGQGFNLGLRDVGALADCLSKTTLARGSTGDPDLLANYARARRKDTRNVAWFTDGLINTFTHTAPPVVVGRNLLLSGLNLLPRARRELLQRTMGLKAANSALARGRALTPVALNESH